MIFESVRHITSKDEFLEKIFIYIRLVEVFAERNKLVITNINDVSKSIIEEAIKIGVINGSDDIPELKSVLKKDFSRFIN